MTFSDRVTQLTDKPPKGWPKVITPIHYAQLDDDTKNYYGTMYSKYRTKKYRDYDEYGGYLGWAEMQVGIGEPIGYKYHGVIIAKVVDSVLSSNVMVTRMLAKK